MMVESEVSCPECVVSECGRTAFDILVSEKCNGICAEIFATGFHPEKYIALRKPPLFFYHETSGDY